MNPKELDHPDPSSVRILGFSDTYGAQSGNGVGRFLQDLHERAVRDDLPLEIVIPGREAPSPGITTIRAPSFVLPGYSKLSVAMPLEHQRKQMERQFRNNPADCIHLSTPGPFGCLGLMLGLRYRVPLIGIYHTDFPSYARQITRQSIMRIASRPNGFVNYAQQFLPTLLQWAARAKEANPDFDQDLVKLAEIAGRNWELLDAQSLGIDALVDASERLTVQIIQRFYSSFTMVIARSNQQQSELQQLLHLPPERIRCLRPGTDIERFHPGRKNRELWSQWKVPCDAFVALYVGRVTAEKNIDWLLRVWNEFQQQAPRESYLVIVGHGEQDDLDHAAEQPNVRVTGSLTGETLSSLYASADCLLFPSVTETLGQVGLEAGAAGIPVVVSDRGGQQMYVKEGQTGYICASNDLTPWVACLNQLCSEPGLSTRMGRNAREHIASQFSMERSIGSYWSLHREAVDAYRDQQRSGRTRQRVVKIPSDLQSRVPERGVMFISDYHAGRRFGSEAQRRFKQAAIEQMLVTAAEQDLEVVFGGDFGDHGAKISRLDADFASFRKVRESVGLTGRPVFLRGNHDYGFSDAQLDEMLGGCEIHPSLVCFHRDSKITMTHGHILALAKTVEVIETAANRDELIARLTEEWLDEDLKPSVIAYDLANLAESTMARQGLTGLTALWEGMYSSRAGVAEHLLRFGRGSGHADEATWKMIAGLVGTHDNAEVLGQLGSRCGGWASVFGHTHEALATKKKVSLPGSNETMTQIVANSGHINSKRPTCVIAKFPTVTVLRYSAKRDVMKPVMRTTLTEDEIRDWVEHDSPSVRVA